MRPTWILVLSSMLMCLAVALAAAGWRQPRPTLDRSIRHLRRHPIASHHGRGTFVDRPGQLLFRTSIGDHAADWKPSLRLIDRDVATHIGVLTLAALAGLVTPALVLTSLQLAGWVSLTWFVPVGLSLVSATAAPIVLHSIAMSRSDDVRIDVRHQLSAYLDMVTMLLAGNTGYEGALEHAARAGDGLLFVELRRRMREVGTTGQSLVHALELVGDDFGVVELEQVAAAAQLSASEGAPVARTMAAKCQTLRSTLAAQQEAAARVRSDKVTPPLVGMALLFMALIIYPALNL